MPLEELLLSVPGVSGMCPLRRQYLLWINDYYDTSHDEH